jgi:hypothetical protein
MARKQASVANRIALIVSGVLVVALMLFFVDTTIDIWPSVGVQSELCKQAETMSPEEREPFLVRMRKNHKVNCRFRDVPVTRVNLGGTHTFLSPDQGMFGIVGLFAALGALLRSLRSVVWASAGWGEEDFSAVWSLLRPVAAAALAILLYVILRALFLPSGTLAAANPYGFIAIAALLGLFCDEMLGWVYARARPVRSSKG